MEEPKSEAKAITNQELLNPESKIKHGESINLERIGLPDEIAMELKAKWQKIKTQFLEFPHIVLNAEEARAYNDDGELSIIIPAYFREGYEEKGPVGSAGLLKVPKRKWDVDNPNLKKLTEIFKEDV